MNSDFYIKNSILQSSSFVLSILLNLFSIPVLIIQLGAENYGISSVCIAVNNIFGLTNMGLGSSLVHHISKYIKVDNDIGYKTLVTTSTVFVLFNSLLIILFINIFSKDLTNVLYSGNDTSLFEACLTITIYSTPFLFLKLITESVVRAEKKIWYESIFNFLFSLVFFISTISTMFFDEGILFFLQFRVIVLAIVCLLYSFLILKLKVISLKDIKKLELKSIMKFGLNDISVQLSNSLIQNAPIFFINKIFGAQFVLIVEVPKRILDLLGSLTYRFTSVIFPVISQLKKSIKEFSNYAIINFSTIRILIFLPCFFAINNFLNIYLGDEFDFKMTSVAVSMTFFYLNMSLSQTNCLIYNGVNLPHINAYFSNVLALFMIICYSIFYRLNIEFTHFHVT
ncbi:MATE family efflux transporter, partial [Flavobacteriaceae bacterium]|nr:MATE family efflux transporter [Flavobacteriaceae bacterium]